MGDADKHMTSSQPTGYDRLTVDDFRPREDDLPDGWGNRSYSILKQRLGIDIFTQREEKQFEDVTSGSGILGTITDTLKRTKLDLFHSHTLRMDPSDQSFSGPKPTGGAGFVNIINNPKFPDHSFFRKGRMLRTRLRHNNLSFEDDAMLDGRVACLKFADKNTGGPLDLIMHTGRTPQYYNAPSFKEFVQAFRSGPDSLSDWCHRKPVNYHGRVENLRKMPESYHNLRYYSHVTYHFVSTDGTLWLARFRMIPTDGSTEKGLLSNTDQSNIWDVKRADNEKKPVDYLRQEYRSRLLKAPIQYRLQIQLMKSTDATKDSQNISLTNVHKGEDSNMNEINTKYDICNPFALWDPSIAPWMDLGTVTISTPLTCDVLGSTKFNIGNHVNSCGPIEPESTKHFTSLSLATRQFHGMNGATEKDPLIMETVYKIVVVTGKMLQAGTDADVYITITGSRGRTPPINLDRPFRDDFEAGHADAFEVTAPNIGSMISVEMAMSSVIRNRRWFLEEVTVYDVTTKMCVRFPCYRWLTSQQPNVVLSRCQALTPQLDVVPLSYLQRKYELYERRLRYEWDVVEGMPGRIKVKRYEDLPKDAQFGNEQEMDLMNKYFRTLANTGSGTVSTLLNMWDIFDDNEKLVTKFLKDKSISKRVAEIWQRDEEFGRQVLNGPHPILIHKVVELPKRLKSAKDKIQSLMDRNMSVEKALQEGHFYMLDYPELDCMEKSKDYKGKYERHITSPVCLLYVNKKNKLLPLAINLEPKGPVWTAKDHPTEWKYIKMWVREADVQIHQVVSRHLHTQLVMEAVAIATLRNLPLSHPIYKLLQPHFKHTIAVNVQGRQYMYPADEGLFQRYLAVGGQHEQLLKEAYKSFHIDQLNLPKNLAMRGVDDPKLLPNYHYRDDGIVLWNTMLKYIRTVVHLHYREDDNVKADEELQTWIQDLGSNGLSQSGDTKDNDAHNHGIPDLLSTMEQLVELTTTFIFTASVQHAALSSGMMDYYSFVPNAPTLLVEPPPNKKGDTSMALMKKALPSRGKTAEIIAACYTLSRYGSHEVYLNYFNEHYFDDEAMRATIDAFKVDMERISANIHQRNKKLDIPYNYLLPERIPKGVSL